MNPKKDTPGPSDKANPNGAVRSAASGGVTGGEENRPGQSPHDAKLPDNDTSPSRSPDPGKDQTRRKNDATGFVPPQRKP
jgi:hypothetical protein